MIRFETERLILRQIQSIQIYCLNRNCGAVKSIRKTLGKANGDMISVKITER